MNQFLVTTVALNNTQYRIAALYEAERRTMMEATVEPLNHTSLLGNIYVGRVENIVKNLNAAFIRIAPGQNCYFSIHELKNPIFTKKQSEKKALCIGDELVVQVAKEALKTKEPTVTTNLTFSGKYVVLTTGKHQLGVSCKLPVERKEPLCQKFQTLLPPEAQRMYGVIVRTNAANVSDEKVIAEFYKLSAQLEQILFRANHASCGTMLYEEMAQWQKLLYGLYENDLKEVITDDRTIFETACHMYGVKAQQASVTAQSGIILRYYEDNMVSLPVLYGITSQIKDALKEKVWLKSGAYLIIQPTEALTVIDVNTGKNIAKKDAQENFRKVNLEAAAEIARQLRLRNISGIIIVDFINLESPDAKKELLNFFAAMVKKDSVPTQVVDMTKLGLVEVTRKKIKKSLAESLREI